MTRKLGNFATIVLLSSLLIACGEVASIPDFLAGLGQMRERDRVLSLVTIGMPLAEARAAIIEETGVTGWDGFWDYPDETSGKSIATDCRKVGICAISPDLPLGAPGERVDWDRFLVVSLYHEPPGVYTGPGDFMYLIFDPQTKLLLAFAYWPKHWPG